MKTLNSSSTSSVFTNKIVTKGVITAGLSVFISIILLQSSVYASGHSSVVKNMKEKISSQQDTIDLLKMKLKNKSGIDHGEPLADGKVQEEPLHGKTMHSKMIGSTENQTMTNSQMTGHSSNELIRYNDSSKNHYVAPWDSLPIIHYP